MCPELKVALRSLDYFQERHPTTHQSRPERERESPYGTEFYLKNPTPLGAAQATFGTGILFEEPNPTGSRPRDLIGLYRR